MENVGDAAPENLKARLKESYDAIAPEYNNWTIDHSPKRMDYVGRLLKLLPGSGQAISVLELGCGAGEPVAKHLLTFPNFTLTANDLSSAQIDLGKKALGEERVKWIQGDMMGLSFADASFDAVMGFYSIIHLPRDEQAEMLGRVQRWLKPGGYMLINFSEEEMAGVVMEKWLHEKGWMYWSGFGREGTLNKIKEAGLEVVVANIEEDEVDVRFLWVIARKPEAQA
jgi:ubiquinone/menaquinone biosynthesis C-methylase UbiE